MKRILSFLLIICMMTVMIAGCNNTPEETTDTSDTTTESTTETTTTETTTESTAETTTTETTTTETTTTDTLCGGTGETTTTEQKTDPEPVQLPESIKILAIGNSFSDDATEHLWGILNDAGIKEVIIGNLYIGGCSIDTHWSNMKNDKAAYTFYYHKDGTKTSSTQSVSYALALHDWDYITVQQVSQNSGQPETLGNLQNVLDYINQNKTNEDAKIYWHSTWAYQQNTSHSGFKNYASDQMTMYNAIVDTYKAIDEKYPSIDGILPSGTAIQNLRTSYLGDTLTRDGYHMTYDIGRYTAALTWCCALTGIDAEAIDWVPAEYLTIGDDLDAIREAVNNAVANPYEVTESSFDKRVVKRLEMTDADRAKLEKLGYDPDDYYVLDLKMMLNVYWVSTSGSSLNTAATHKATNFPYFAASARFDRNQLPIGSIICLEKGYQYRPEGWISTGLKNSIRPVNVQTESVVIDLQWWGAYQYRAFNLSYEDGATNMTEADLDKIRVYIPVEPVIAEKYSALTESDISALEKAGLNPDNYQVLNLDLTIAAYYNSQNGSSMVNGTNSTAGNLTKFIATQILSKEDLPNGTVLSLKYGYQYRPEGWTELNTKTAKRPDNVTTSLVTVNDAWWGDFNYRAFNIAYQSTSTDMAYKDINALRIYVPKN
ncbi:MAG: DUF4886 domain-containing protein [Clostridia bacterium]|nr:DUF4886 domain-containing protein [Clostridia bacterium]